MPLRDHLDFLDRLESCVPEGMHWRLDELRQHLLEQNVAYLEKTGQLGRHLYDHSEGYE